MYYSPDATTAKIYDELFCFHGSLNANGILLNLRGKVFNDAQLQPNLLIGQQFTETVFWQSSENTPQLLKNAIEGSAKGHKSKLLIDFRISAKNVIAVEISFFPTFNDAGQIVEILFFAQDVDAREKEISFHKERSEQFLYASESAGIGLWFWDLAENKIVSTPTANRLFEIPPFEVINSTSFLNSLHPDDSEKFLEDLKSAQATGQEYDIEFRVVHSDGTIHNLRTRGKTFYDKDHNPINMMGMVRETSEITDTDTKNLTQILERERKALDEAEEANRAKDYFMAFISHELRTPLNSILGWAKILLTKKVDEPTLRNALETIERGAKSQAKLIEDLVDSARITSGKLRLELRPTNLFNIINNSYNLQKPAAEAKQINFIFDPKVENAEVFGDPIRLQQVFNNLITNALKFTPSNGTIAINLEILDKQAVVTVTDSGHGISEEILPKIFKKFVQADKTMTRDKSGLGLGLTIVKTLVEKQGGSVRAESKGLGKGAKFIVSLPIHSTDTGNLFEEQIHISQNGSKPLRGLNILIVEDDFDSREVLKIFLEQNGATVKDAQSPPDALKILSQSNRFLPNLIISDIAMPMEDGYSLITKIRNLPDNNLNQIPAIALSAFGSVENKEKAFKSGFQRYHTKPFESDLLIEEITMLLKNKK